MESLVNKIKNYMREILRGLNSYLISKFIWIIYGCTLISRLTIIFTKYDRYGREFHALFVHR